MFEWKFSRSYAVVSRRELSALSRRDNRTQPGVLTPGYRSKKRARPEGAEDRGGRTKRKSEFYGDPPR